MSDLLARSTYCIGTVRVNRKHFPKFGKRNIKSLERGESMAREVLGDKVHCFVWCDKKPVAFVNTICDARDFAAVRRKQSDGSTIVVQCPSAVVLYNNNMGGVDLADHRRKLYSSSRKSKVKWYMRLFYYLLDIAFVNAHILESESPNHVPTRPIGKKKKCQYRTQKAFMLELIEELIGNHTSRKKWVGLSLLWVVFNILSNTILQCMISLQNVCTVVSQVQENAQSMGVINVEVFTSVVTHVLRNTTLCKVAISMLT